MDLLEQVSLFSEDGEVIGRLSSRLTEVGCCPRCTLRFMGETKCHLYKHGYEKLFSLVQGLAHLSIQKALAPVTKETGEQKKEPAPVTMETSEQKEEPAPVTMETSEQNKEPAPVTMKSSEQNKEPALVNMKIREQEKNAPVTMETNDQYKEPSSDKIESRDRRLEPPSMSGNQVEMSTSMAPCVLCLGVLQQFCTQAFVDKVSCVSVCSPTHDNNLHINTDVEKAGFQFTQHFCSLMLPPCVIIREHSLWLYLEEQFPEVYNCHCIENVSTIKDVWKWRMGPILSLKLGAPFEIKSQFDICTTFSYVRSSQECTFLSDLFPDIFKRRKTNAHYGWEMFTRASVSKALSETANSSFRKCYGCPPPRPVEACHCKSIVPSHKHVYLAGRYNKYSRSLSQTPWVIEGQKKTENSVEELVCNLILPKFKPDDHRFSASGREDVDVRMLGSGRPFLIQLINPHMVNHSCKDIQQLQKLVNSSTTDIAVRDLQLVPRDETAILKEGELEKTKSYMAQCWCQRPLTEDDLQKLEDTKMFSQASTVLDIPHLKKRSLAVRERTVYTLRAEVIDDHHFKLHLSTQAGTYIKEFVHGDLGRTKPNLGTILGAECDILELDVESVDMDWPKRLDDVETADTTCATLESPSCTAHESMEHSSIS